MHTRGVKKKKQDMNYTRTTIIFSLSKNTKHKEKIISLIIENTLINPNTCFT